MAATFAALVLVLVLSAVDLAAGQRTIGSVEDMEIDLLDGLTFAQMLLNHTQSLQRPDCSLASTEGSILVDTQKVKGAKEILKGNSSFLPVWSPEGNKSLHLWCWKGGASNRKLCLRNHLLIAASLNWTLLVDSRETSLWSIMVDTSLVRACFGERTAVPWEEGGAGQSAPAAARSSEGPSPQSPLAPLPSPWLQRGSGHIGSITNPKGISFSLRHSFKSWMEEMLALKESSVGFENNFLINAAENPTFHSHFIYGDIPFRRKPGCNIALGIMPPPRVVYSAQQWVQKQFGTRNFVSFHWRQGDFLQHYCGGAPDMFPSSTICLRESTIFNCLAHKAQKAGVRDVLVLSNGRSDTLERLDKHLQAQGLKTVLNPRLATQHSLLLAHKDDAEIEFLKWIAAFSYVFVGTESSTFTADIERMRKGIGMETCMDSIICEGLPFAISNSSKFYNYFSNSL